MNLNSTYESRNIRVIWTVYHRQSYPKTEYVSHSRNEFKELVFVIHFFQAWQSLLISRSPLRFVERPTGKELLNTCTLHSAAFKAILACTSKPFREISTACVLIAIV